MVPGMIRRCYPGGALKAFNVTYDDGVTQDARFVELLDLYGLKGTFNLNSQLMEERFEWVHDCGMVIKRLSPEEALDIYGDHEIASHTLTHPYMRGKMEEELLWELGEDKRQLEKLFGREVAGFAVPFHYYSQQISAMVRRCGFSYGRCSEECRSYSPYRQTYRWETGIFHRKTFVFDGKLYIPPKLPETVDISVFSGILIPVKTKYPMKLSGSDDREQRTLWRTH